MTTVIVRFFVLLVAALGFSACSNTVSKNDGMMNETLTGRPDMNSGYAEINGLKMYYEVYGQGKPLVLIHGGGSTIQTTFGRVIPLFSKNRQLIAVELQAHGRTSDRNTPLSFEQDADDVVALLKKLGIQQADIFGFSNGGNTALQIALRYPELCNKVIAGSVLLKRDGTFPQFWEFMKNGTFDQMPAAYKESFLQVNPDSTKLLNMHQKCADRMINFQEFTDAELQGIQTPVLLINGDADVATTEHIAAMSRIIPHCNIAIIPGGHGAYIGEITTVTATSTERDWVVPLIERFLDSDPSRH